MVIEKVHNSHLTTFRRCKKKFEYKYIENIEPIRPGLPLVRGIWVHYMLQAQYLRWGIEKDSLLVTPESIHIDGIGEVRIHYGDNLYLLVPVPDEEWKGGVEPPESEYPLSASGMLSLLTDNVWDKLFPDEQTEYVEGGLTLPEQASKVLTEYFYHYGESVKDIEPLLVEYEGEREDKSGVIFEGRIDLLLRDKKGRVGLRDWKTTKFIPSGTWKLKEKQLHLYPWMLEPFLEGHGLSIDYVEFDWMSTSLPTKPSQNKDGSLSKRKIKTTALTYQQALKEYGIKVTEEHREEIDRLKREGGDDFFRRNKMPRMEGVTETLLRENVADSRLMNELFDNPLMITRTEMRSCDWDCGYTELCMGELYGQDVSLILNKQFQPRQNSKSEGKVEEDE